MGISLHDWRRMRRSAITLPVIALLLCCTCLASAASHPCLAKHGSRYCRAVMHRKAIRIVRKQERVEAARAQVPLKISEHRLPWTIGPLWRANRWERRRLARLRAMPTPIPHEAEWLCIAHYESGTDWTMTPPASGGPYWGGLQMDTDFQRTYGSDMLARHNGGLANTWTADEQMTVANRAYQTRGFQPWPQTSLMCGLSY